MSEKKSVAALPVAVDVEIVAHPFDGLLVHEVLHQYSASRVRCMEGIAVNSDDTYDLTLRTAVYGHFATTGQSPTLDAMRETTGATTQQVMEGYRRLYGKRMLVPAGDSATIQMAPPFSGVPTQHRLTVDGKEYFANCAWDAFGVVSALGGTGDVLSRCEQTREPLLLHLTPDGPPPSEWLFHCIVPASEWWNDIVFT